MKKIKMKIDDFIEKMLLLKATNSELEEFKKVLVEKSLLEGINNYLKKYYSIHTINSLDDFIEKYKRIRDEKKHVLEFEDYLVKNAVTGSVAGYVDVYLDNEK
jgi:hypothetical protein